MHLENRQAAAGKRNKSNNPRVGVRESLASLSYAIVLKKPGCCLSSSSIGIADEFRWKRGS